MALNNKNFSVMAYANGFTLWNYSSEDELSAIKGAAYFNEIAPFARQGDMILTVASAKTTPACAVLYISSIADGVVTVADINPAAAG